MSYKILLLLSLFNFLLLLGLSALFKVFFSFQKQRIENIIAQCMKNRKDFEQSYLNMDNKLQSLCSKICNKEIKVNLITYKKSKNK
jgi:hypothetical protein